MIIKAIIFDAGGVLYLNDKGRGFLNKPLAEFIHDNQEHYRFGIISTTNYDLKTILEKDGIRDLFDVILTSGETGLNKTESLIYKQTLDLLETTPEETIFIDNDEEYIKTADDIGIRTILYTNFETFKIQIARLI